MTELIQTKPSERPVTEETVLTYLNRELGPAVRAALSRINLLIKRREWIAEHDSSGSTVIDWSQSDVATLALDSSVDVAFVAPTVQSAARLELLVTYGGAYAITWPSSGIVWENGTPPVLTSAAGAIDRISFLYAAGVYYGHARLGYA